jgi:hypothetical protein
MKHIDDWGFYLAMASIAATMSILMATDSLPEKAAARFNTLTDVTIATNYKLIKEPTPEDNTLVYAINEVAQKAIPSLKRIHEYKKL